MGTIEELTGTILADARAQAMRIDDETREEVGRIEAQTTKLVAAERERVRAKAKRDQEEIEQRVQAKRRLEATQKTLRAKQELLDETFAAAQRELHAMTPARRKRLITALHDRVKREIAIGSITASKKDARFIKGARVGSVSDGFIAKSKDGKVTIDMRFETLLADIKARKTGDIARILFTPVLKTGAPAKTVAKPKTTTKPKRPAKPKRGR